MEGQHTSIAQSFVSFLEAVGTTQVFHDTSIESLALSRYMTPLVEDARDPGFGVVVKESIYLGYNLRRCLAKFPCSWRNRYCKSSGRTAAEADALDKEAKAEAKAASEFALGSRDPDPKEAEKYLYAGDGE